MATAQFATMSVAHRPTPTLKTENFDMDSFFDFTQSTTTNPSPVTATSSRLDVPSQQDWAALSPYDQTEDQPQHFNGPSHDYHQYKQQVGLPSGFIGNASMSQGPSFDGYGSGIGDMGFNSGIDSSAWDIDADMAMDVNVPQPIAPNVFYPTGHHDSQSDTFVNPGNIGGQEEAPSNVRLWPGMHSQQAQQAAMQKAALQQQMAQQRQMKMQGHYRQRAPTRQAQPQQQSQPQSQPQHQQQQQQPTQGNGKQPAHVSEFHVEESISRLLNQMRHNSAASSNGDDDAASPGGSVLPHIARMRKDEEEMDEDERLLASEEGKKLSSKERRQLRNKVSARAFRSRRKEYIGQLEGDLAMKAQETSNLRQANADLTAENERYRALIETLLRHQAFRPFLEDVSQNPAALGPVNGQQMATPAPSQQQSSSQQSTPVQQPQHHLSQHEEMKPDFEFSKLNINGFGQVQDFNNYHSSQSMSAL